MGKKFLNYAIERKLAKNNYHLNLLQPNNFLLTRILQNLRIYMIRKKLQDIICAGRKYMCRTGDGR